MRALVTGGAGFIGSHLVEALLKENHEVIVLDDLSTGTTDNLPQNNSALKFEHTDIHSESLLKFFKGQNIDVVFHLAAKAAIVQSVQYPISYHDTNVTGTVRVLEAARICGVKRFVYASSASRYGLAGRGPDTDPRYPYALTKLIGEQYVEHWHQVYKMSTCSLTFFNVYGPRARSNSAYGAVFGVFLAQLANNKPLTIVGDGEQERDFIYVSDVVEAIMLAGGCEFVGRLDIGSGVPQSISKLAKLLQGPNSHINYVPERPSEPDCTVANINDAKRFLRWYPKVSFEEGVALMKKEMPKYKDAPVWTPSTIEKATLDWFKYLG